MEIIRQPLPALSVRQAGGRHGTFLPPLNQCKYKTEGSGIRFTDVTAMAPGIWNDSKQKTNFYVNDRAMRDNAQNWSKYDLWDGHDHLSSPIGYIDNHRFDTNRNEVCCDLVLHGKTKSSKHAIDRILSGKITDVSPEIKTVERWNAAQAAFEVTQIEYTGLALVPTGACKTCKIRMCGGGGGYSSLKKGNRDKFKDMTCGCGQEGNPDQLKSKDVFTEYDRRHPAVRMLSADGTIESGYLSRLEDQVEMIKSEIVHIDERLLAARLPGGQAYPHAALEEIKTSLATITQRLDDVDAKQRELSAVPQTSAGASTATAVPALFVQQAGGRQGNLVSISTRDGVITAGGF